GRASAPALPGDRPQPPADRAARGGAPQAPVLLHLAARPTTPEPGPRPGGPELRRNGRSRGPGPGRRAHGRPRRGLARRVAQGAGAGRGGGGLAAALRERGGSPMAERMIPGGGRRRDGESRAPGRRPAVAAPTRVRPRIVPVALLASLACVATPVGTRGQLPVIDAANLVQNTLTALKT